MKPVDNEAVIKAIMRYLENWEGLLSCFGPMSMLDACRVMEQVAISDPSPLHKALGRVWPTIRSLLEAYTQLLKALALRLARPRTNDLYDLQCRRFLLDKAQEKGGANDEVLSCLASGFSSSIEPIRAFFSSLVGRECLYFFQKVAKSPDADVVQVLLEVLDDDFSSWSCSTALEALRSCCDAELLETRALRHLLKLLKTKSNSLVKCAALKALHAVHNGEVTDLAARLARQDPIDSVRLAALQLLRGQEAAEVSNLAVEVLCTDSSETVLLGALEVLTPLSAAGSAGKAAVEAAKKLLIHPSRQVRLESARLLGTASHDAASGVTVVTMALEALQAPAKVGVWPEVDAEILLPAEPKVLAASLADARAAVSLAQQLTSNSTLALKAARALNAALAESGEGPMEAQQACDALAGALRSLGFDEPVKHELRQVAKDGIDTAGLCAEMDASAKDGESPGTFRWPRRMVLPTLPSGPSLAAAVTEKGWGPYLRQRGGEQMVNLERSKLAMMLDALSFPLSLAWLLLQEPLDAQLQSREIASGTLHVVVLGATSKAEVRILEDSDYWEDPGPVGRTHGPRVTQQERFGALEFSITSQDLTFLADQHVLCAFFCANDYADLKGEVAVHQLLGSCFALRPRQNPFAMATVYSGEDSSEWFSGNAFVYAVCGFERSARRVELSTAEVLQIAQSDHAIVHEAPLPVRLLESERSSSGSTGVPPVSTVGEMKPMDGGWRFEVPLADASCMQAADVQISDTQLSLVLEGLRRVVPWPTPVDSASARASFSARSRSGRVEQGGRDHLRRFRLTIS
eukprot:g13928.t1